jgi:hypothetical protein
MINQFGKVITIGEVGNSGILNANWRMQTYDSGSGIDALDFDTNLVSRYAFAGNGNDSFGTKHLTANGSPTYVEAIYGLGADLESGSSMYYQAGNTTDHDQTTNDFSITCWIKLESIGSQMTILGKRNEASSTNDGWLVAVNASGNIIVQTCDGSAAAITTSGATVLNTGEWYFVAVTWDRDGNCLIYLDGNQDNQSGSSISAQATSMSNSVEFRIGRSGSAGTNYFDGVIDQVQIFSGLLSQADIDHILYKLHGGMKAVCKFTASGFTAGLEYRRNIENTAWDKNFGLPDQGELRVYDSDSSHYAGWKAPSAVTTSYVGEMPAAPPATNQQLMWFSSAGVASFKTPNMYPINIDTVAGSTVSEAASEQVSKSYVLPANDYDKIMIVMGWECGGLSNLDAEDTAAVNMAVGATVFSPHSVIFNQISGTEDYSLTFAGETTFIVTQQSSVTIKAMYWDADASPDSGPTKRCVYLYVFGLRYT